MQTLKGVPPRAMGFSLAAFIGLAVLGVASATSFAQQQPLKRTDLLQAAVGAAGATEVVSYVVDAVPGAEVGRHRHPGDEFLYVLDGAVTVMPDKSAPVTVSQGEIFHLKYKVPHGARNASDTEPARVIVFQVVEAGKPVSEPVE